jgi:hypothetical protein
MVLDIALQDESGAFVALCGCCCFDRISTNGFCGNPINVFGGFIWYNVAATPLNVLCLTFLQY